MRDDLQRLIDRAKYYNEQPTVGNLIELMTLIDELENTHEKDLESVHADADEQGFDRGVDSEREKLDTREDRLVEFFKTRIAEFTSVKNIDIDRLYDVFLATETIRNDK